MQPLWVEGVAWASDALNAPVTYVVELPGGMTSTILAVTDETGRRSVLRLMTRDPWRAHGAELIRREAAALHELADTRVPAPLSIALDADGAATGVAAHLMSHLPGRATGEVTDEHLEAMVDQLVAIHAVEPSAPFRDFQSWAWEAKRVVPGWSTHPESWRRAFDLLSGDAPTFAPMFLHRDYSHRNLLWEGVTISGVVDWLETSTGPAGLDAAHVATNLTLAHGPERALAFLAAYGTRAGEEPDTYWLLLDAVGFLPPPGRSPLFGSATELARLDAWVHHLVAPLPDLRTCP